MKEYRRCFCEWNHSWTVFINKGESLKPEDSFCSEGHKAVRFRSKPMVDCIQVTLRPAARVVDEVKNTIGFEGLYYIIISDLAETWQRTSKGYYSLDEIIPIMKILEKRPSDWAIKYWDRKKL